MYIVPTKYRNTQSYDFVYKHLCTAANNKELLSYSPIWKLMGLKPGNNAAKEAGHMLGEISEDTHRSGKPLLSAIVINKQKKEPGLGFYILAEQLGTLLENKTDAEKKSYWEIERDKVFSESW
jgi:hypothetical protein